jgi:hypothetical protein
MGGFMRHGIVSLLLLFLAAGDAFAQATTGTVRGTITDSVSHRPVAGARVTVEGTALGAVTNVDGAYTLANVPTGSQGLRATSIGYGAARQLVSVGAGQTVTADFALIRVAQQLQVMAVTVTGCG